LVAAFLAVSVFSLGTYLISMLLGLQILFFTSPGLELARQSIHPLDVPLFFQLGLRLPWPITLGELFAALWLVFAASMAAAWLGPPRSFTEAIRDSLRTPFRKLLGNYLLAMPILANMLLFLVHAITDLQGIYGVPTGGIGIPDPYRGLVELSYASVVEELAFRIVPLGLVVFLRVLIAPVLPGTGWKRLAWAFLNPERAKSRSGLGGVSEKGLARGLSLYEWAMVLFSAAFFALAHILASVGWQVGKLTTAFISGIALGLAYLYYGAAAPILLHWYFNYYGGILEFAVQLYSGPISAFASLSDLFARVTGGLAWLTLSLYLFSKAFRAAPRADSHSSTGATHRPLS